MVCARRSHARLQARSPALTALAHEATAAELIKIVGSFGADPGAARDLFADLGPAVVTCGTSCLPILQRLASSGDEGMRFAAYRAGTSARPDDRGAFTETILKSQAAGASLDPEEMALRRTLLRLE